MSSVGRMHKKYEHIIFFAAGGMGGAVSPPGGPGRFPGRGKAPIFFFIKHAKTVTFRVNMG